MIRARRLAVQVAGTILGDVQALDDVRVEGQVRGNVTVPKARVCIAVGARVEGFVHAGEVLVAGELSGDCRADVVRLLPTARVAGRIESAALTIEVGARFNGESLPADGCLVGPDAA